MTTIDSFVESFAWFLDYFDVFFQDGSCGEQCEVEVCGRIPTRSNGSNNGIQIRSIVRNLPNR